MPDLREQLQQCFQGRVCLMGLGNVLYGDDGFGVRLAEKLKSEGRSPRAEGDPKSEARSEDPDSSCSDFGLRPSFGLRSHVVIAGTAPERFIGRVTDESFDHVIFLDAVEFGGRPGSAILLDAPQMSARYPQISTHKISLGLLAKWAEANGTTRAWLLGVQPESLKEDGELTPAVQATLQLLLELLKGSSRGNEALSSRAPRLDEQEHLSLVISAATRTTEVTA
jgi:hydrogenase 3 maturation protease